MIKSSNNPLSPKQILQTKLHTFPFDMMIFWYSDNVLILFEEKYIIDVGHSWHLRRLMERSLSSTLPHYYYLKLYEKQTKTPTSWSIQCADQCFALSKRGFEFCTACDNFLGFLPRRFEVPWTMKALCHIVDW